MSSASLASVSAAFESFESDARGLGSSGIAAAHNSECFATIISS
jgi:hypothetical protein